MYVCSLASTIRESKLLTEGLVFDLCWKSVGKKTSLTFAPLSDKYLVITFVFLGNSATAL